MVHRHLGSARITYPTGVKVSPVDPMTSANLPRELRLVPGVVSRPVRIGAMTAEQHIAQFMMQASGDAYQAATLAALARMGDPLNLALRNAEHALFSRSVLQKLGPVLGRGVVATSVPLYSAAKAIGQPFGAFKGATAPSWQEVQYGLQPLFPQKSTITGYASVGVWPGAVSATAADCMAYIATHGGAGHPGTGCKAVYSNGTSGPLIPYSPTTARLHGVGYYPNLGQDAGAAAGYLPASLSGVPTWVWWVAGYGVLALLLGGVFYGAPKRRQPAVRTVTRTTY